MKAYKLCLELVRRQYKIVPINRAGTSIDIAKLSAVRLSHFNSLPAPQVGAFHGRPIRGQARVIVYNVTQYLINMRTEYNLPFKLTEEISLTICVRQTAVKTSLKMELCPYGNGQCGWKLIFVIIYNKYFFEIYNINFICYFYFIIS